MKILVTGSNGMIGTRLCEKLLSLKHTVYGADIRKNLFSKRINLLTKRVDLRSSSQMKSLPNQVDLVIHLGASSRVMDTIKNPVLAVDNFQMTANVLQYCIDKRVKGIIFSSSREVYGNLRRRTCKEEYSGKIENPYGASKLACEGLIQAYSVCFGLKYCILRFSNVYGMYDQSERVIPFFIKQIENKKLITIFGKEKTLDFTYIEDVINGISMTVKKFKSVSNSTINIASGKGTTLISLTRLLGTVMGMKPKVKIIQNRQGEVMRFVADISKAKKLLGYKTQDTLKTGIAKTIIWHNEQKRRFS